MQKQSTQTTRTIKLWPQGAHSQLQHCFDLTDWSILEWQDLPGFTDTVSCYTKFRTDNITVDKCIRVYPNRKFGVTNEVQSLLRARNAAYRTGDKALHSKAGADQRRGLKV